MSPDDTSGQTPLTHFDAEGQAHMVDVGGKAHTARVARAAGSISMLPDTFALVRSGTAKKGDVLGIARIAGIQASKRTSDLIPLCHPIALTKVSVEFTLDAACVAGAVRSDGTHHRPDRGRDGSPDRRQRCAAHHLRHVQGGRSRHADRRHPPAGKSRRKIRALAGRLILPAAPAR
jgi:hypothetical protein